MNAKVPVSLQRLIEKPQFFEAETAAMSEMLEYGDALSRARNQQGFVETYHGETMISAIGYDQPGDRPDHDDFVVHQVLDLEDHVAEAGYKFVERIFETAMEYGIFLDL